MNEYKVTCKLCGAKLIHEKFGHRDSYYYCPNVFNMEHRCGNNYSLTVCEIFGDNYNKEMFDVTEINTPPIIPSNHIPTSYKIIDTRLDDVYEKIEDIFKRLYLLEINYQPPKKDNFVCKCGNNRYWVSRNEYLDNSGKIFTTVANCSICNEAVVLVRRTIDRRTGKEIIE